MLHIRPEKHTLLGCIHELFDIVETLKPQNIVYFNSTTSGPLRKALAGSSLLWTRDELALKAFSYERVSDIVQLHDMISLSHYDMVVVERLDNIVQESTSVSYSVQNKLLASVVSTVKCAIFIDDWEYLDKYYRMASTKAEFISASTARTEFIAKPELTTM